MEGFASELTTATKVFTLLTKSTLFLCHHKGLHVIIYLDDILILLAPSVLARELKHSCVFFWFVLDYILNFPSLKSISCSSCLFGACVGIQ